MKGRVEGKALAEAMGLVKGTIQVRQTLPVLSAVHLTMRDGSLRIRATNLEQAIALTVPAEVEQAGELAPNGVKLGLLAREVSGESLALESRGSQLVIQAKADQWTLAGVDPKDMPGEVPLEEAVGFQVNSKALLEALRQVEYAVSSDQSRYALCGVRLQIAGQAGVLAATDGHRLAQSGFTLDGPATEGRVEAIVPAAALGTLAAALKAQEEVQLVFSGTMLQIEAGAIRFQTRLVEGQFPNLEQVLAPARAFPLQGQVSVVPWLQGLRRALLMSEERTHPVRLQFSAEGLQLEVQSIEAGEARVQVPARWEGEAFTIGFNGWYLADWLGTVEAEEATVRVKDPLSPMQLTAPGAAEYLVMPMRM